MAGAGYKTFAAADVLTAAQVNTYLMQQSVPRFATTDARDAAITAPSSGQLAYVDSGDKAEGVYTYNGTAWRLPWNMPWGYVAETVTPPSTNQTISTTGSIKITGTDTESCSIFANRRYRATCISNFQKTTSTNFTYLGAKTSAGASLGSNWTFSMGSSDQELIVFVVTFTGITYTGTIQLNAQILGGGLTIVNTAGLGSRVLVEDIGPVGAPV